jgi:hypothetical protein
MPTEKHTIQRILEIDGFKCRRYDGPGTSGEPCLAIESPSKPILPKVAMNYHRDGVVYYWPGILFVADSDETDMPSIRVGTEGEVIKIGDKIRWNGLEGTVTRTYRQRSRDFPSSDGDLVEFKIERSGSTCKTNPAMDPAWGGLVKHSKTAALKVICLDKRIRAWLQENDPQALKQAEAALGDELCNRKQAEGHIRHSAHMGECVDFAVRLTD